METNSCVESSDTWGPKRPPRFSSKGSGGWSTGGTTRRYLDPQQTGSIVHHQTAWEDRRSSGGSEGRGHGGSLRDRPHRWATHGPPNQVNAHPHESMDGQIALVHNGIIENAPILKKRLESRGYRFNSETDTEVLAHLVDEAFKEVDTLEDAVAAALLQVEGAYGVAVVSSKDPNKIVAARNQSPLLLGIGDKGEFLVVLRRCSPGGTDQGCGLSG